MKNLKFLFLLLIYVSYSYTINHKPITFIIDNKTDKALELILEYKIDQYYQHTTKSGTPFTPLYIQVHSIPIIRAGKQVTITLPINDCLPFFCFLDYNLKKYGFKASHKVINANIAVQEYNYSFDFKKTTTNNSIIKIAFTDHKQATLSITHS